MPYRGREKSCRKIQCDKTQIQSILLKKEEIIKDFEENVSSKKKRCRGVNNDEIEKTLLDWFWKGRNKNIPVTGSMLQEMGEETVDSWKKRLPRILQGWAPSGIWTKLLSFSEPFPVT